MENIILPKIRKELIYCEHKSLQISRFAKLASFTVAGAMPQSANLLISCALHSHNDASLRNLGTTCKTATEAIELLESDTQTTCFRHDK